MHKHIIMSALEPMQMLKLPLKIKGIVNKVEIKYKLKYWM